MAMIAGIGRHIPIICRVSIIAILWLAIANTSGAAEILINGDFEAGEPYGYLNDEFGVEGVDQRGENN